MIITKISEIKNVKLRVAVSLVEEIGRNCGEYSFENVYVDKRGKCSVSFKGIIPEHDMGYFKFHLSGDGANDAPYVAPSIEYLRNYEYSRDEKRTILYTGDNWNYYSR